MPARHPRLPIFSSLSMLLLLLAPALIHTTSPLAAQTGGAFVRSVPGTARLIGPDGQPFFVWAVVTGADLQSSLKTLLDTANPTPAGLAYINVALALLIPTAIAVNSP